MSDVAGESSDEMRAAIADLWKLSPPGPENLLAHPAFARLREACRNPKQNEGTQGPNFALDTALTALGLPCGLHVDNAHLALPVNVAAARLDAALRANNAKRTHLVPLDFASDLPQMSFGSARVSRFSAVELRNMIDEPRLKRFYPRHDFEADRFSQFHWLVVEEDVRFQRDPEGRANPILSMNLGQDLGRIEPHKGRFPEAVEEALFFLLMAPWEEWSTMLEVDWRGFRAPWVYTVDADIFVRPPAVPSPDSLTWGPANYVDDYGQTLEAERPVELPSSDDAAIQMSCWYQSKWQLVERAKKSVLFETPIEHFLVRAFLAEGIDEFLAHVTSIEAALGLRKDYGGSAGGTPKAHKNLKPSERVKFRVAGLLDDPKRSDEYNQVFNLRSDFLHGRKMGDISTGQRVMARTLARHVVNALVTAAQSDAISSREDFLEGLLEKGIRLSQSGETA